MEQDICLMANLIEKDLLGSELFDSNTSNEWKYLYPKQVSSYNPIPLNAAVVNSRHDYLAQYINRGADVNCQDFMGWTCAHCACLLGKSKELQFLLDNTIIDMELIDQFDHERTALHIAVETRRVTKDDDVGVLLFKNDCPLDTLLR